MPESLMTGKLYGEQTLKIRTKMTFIDARNQLKATVDFQDAKMSGQIELTDAKNPGVMCTISGNWQDCLKIGSEVIWDVEEQDD